MAARMNQLINHLISFILLLHCFDIRTWAEKKTLDDPEAMGMMDTILELIGGNEKTECEKFTCDNGYQPKENPYHKKSSNGCGSYGLTIPTKKFKALGKCCETHDFCYDTCFSHKNKCDEDFYTCIIKACQDRHKSGKFNKEEYEGCKATAKIFEASAKAVGCHAFKESQKKACYCGPVDLQEKRIAAQKAAEQDEKDAEKKEKTETKKKKKKDTKEDKTKKDKKGSTKHVTDEL